MIDVQRGRTTLADKVGNDGADKLAVAGAEQHAVDMEIIAASVLRKQHAKDVQHMFIAIIKARQLQEQCLDAAGDVGDRGSDAGDCMHPCCDESELSGTSFAHASDTELICHGSLNDECDEGMGTCFGAVQ
jgi:hypothetical protein